ncbi:MAG: acyl-CoA dehydrogenase family protein, partial [Xanthobacteraceae bacterium]
MAAIAHHLGRLRVRALATNDITTIGLIMEIQVMAKQKLEAVDAAVPDTADLVARTNSVASVAGANAKAVDCEARFPHEALAAARKHRLLGIMVAQDLGGEGASVSEIVNVCYVLGRACASVHDICDASDQSRLPGSSRPRQCLARAYDAPAVRR